MNDQIDMGIVDNKQEFSERSMINFMPHVIYVGVIVLMLVSMGFYFVNNKKTHSAQLEKISVEKQVVAKELADLNTELETNIPPVLSHLGFSCEQAWRGCIKEVLSNIEKVGEKSKTIEAFKAIQGYKAQVGPSVPAGKLENSADCLQGLKEGSDEKYCVVEKPKGNLGYVSGVVEIYFEIPDEYADTSSFSYTAHIELGCKSALNILEETKYLEWKKIGNDLNAGGYKPDGTYGYLSCPFDGLSDTVVDVPVTAHDGKVGIRIVEAESTARALVDRIYIQAIKK